MPADLLSLARLAPLLAKMIAATSYLTSPPVQSPNSRGPPDGANVTVYPISARQAPGSGRQPLAQRLCMEGDVMLLLLLDSQNNNKTTVNKSGEM